MNRVSRWWARVAGLPARALANRLFSRLSSESYEGLELAIADKRLEGDASRFFARTRDALATVAKRAPTSYAELRKDTRRIVLLPDDPESPYNPFQLAVVVPARIALEADDLSYAAWLLYASGLARGGNAALERARELLSSLPPDQRRAVEDWLSTRP